MKFFSCRSHCGGRRVQWIYLVLVCLLLWADLLGDSSLEKVEPGCDSPQPKGRPVPTSPTPVTKCGVEWGLWGAAHSSCHHITYSYPDLWLAMPSRTHSAKLIDEEMVCIADGHPDGNNSQQAGKCRRRNTSQVPRGTLCEKGMVINPWVLWGWRGLLYFFLKKVPVSIALECHHTNTEELHSCW